MSEYISIGGGWWYSTLKFKKQHVRIYDICKIFVSEKRSEYMLVGLTQLVIS